MGSNPFLTSQGDRQGPHVLQGVRQVVHNKDDSAIKAMSWEAEAEWWHQQAQTDDGRFSSRTERYGMA